MVSPTLTPVWSAVGLTRATLSMVRLGAVAPSESSRHRWDATGAGDRSVGVVGERQKRWRVSHESGIDVAWVTAWVYRPCRFQRLQGQEESGRSRTERRVVHRDVRHVHFPVLVTR